MVSVSRKWILEYVESLYGFGGQFELGDINNIKVPKGGFETTLTSIGKQYVEWGKRTEKFQILIPDGIGWADAVPKSEYSGENGEY